MATAYHRKVQLVKRVKVAYTSPNAAVVREVETPLGDKETQREAPGEGTSSSA